MRLLGRGESNENVRMCLLEPCQPSLRCLKLFLVLAMVVFSLAQAPMRLIELLLSDLESEWLRCRRRRRRQLCLQRGDILLDKWCSGWVGQDSSLERFNDDLQNGCLSSFLFWLLFLMLARLSICMSALTHCFPSRCVDPISTCLTDCV